MRRCRNSSGLQQSLGSSRSGRSERRKCRHAARKGGFIVRNSAVKQQHTPVVCFRCAPPAALAELLEQRSAQRLRNLSCCIFATAECHIDSKRVAGGLFRLRRVRLERLHDEQGLLRAAVHVPAAQQSVGAVAATESFFWPTHGEEHQRHGLRMLRLSAGGNARSRSRTASRVSGGSFKSRDPRRHSTAAQQQHGMLGERDKRRRARLADDEAGAFVVG